MSSCSCSCGRRRRPSAALVVATLALFLSLGGTSYAAVKAGSIGNKQLASNAVSTQKIRPAAVTGPKIRNGAVTNGKIGTGAVTGGKIRNGAVTTNRLADGAVTGRKIARNAVTSQSVLDGSLGGQDIARGSLGTQHIARGSLGTESLTPDVVSRLLGAWNVGTASGDGKVQQISTTEFTTVRSLSLPEKAAGATLVQAQAAVRATSTSTVTCFLTRNDDPMASSPVTVREGERQVVPVQTITALRTGDVVQLRCVAPDGSAFLDSNPITSSLTAVRVGP